MTKVLLVEDDARIASFIRRGLEAEGYFVDLAENGREALALARENGARISRALATAFVQCLSDRAHGRGDLRFHAAATRHHFARFGFGPRFFYRVVGRHFSR